MSAWKKLVVIPALTLAIAVPPALALQRRPTRSRSAANRRPRKCTPTG